MQLTLVVPPCWWDRRGAAQLERAHTAGYELLVAPLAFNGQYHLHFYPTLGHILRHLHPDILHMDEEPYNLATWHALRIGQAVGARGLFFTWQNLPRRYPLPFSLFERANYGRAAYALAGNEAAREVLRAKGYRGPVDVVPQFGVDPLLFCPSSLGAPRSSPFTVGYLGALLPEKGVDLLLRACARLADQDWCLEIVGDGSERAHLVGLAEELGIAAQVHFAGRVPSAEAAAHYARFDVLVLPSITRPNWMEQFGRVLIEAMACGVPVIGSSSGEIPRVIGEAGIIFPEGDVDALRAAIAGLAAAPGRRAELGMRGRSRVLEHFTQAHIAAATHHAYVTMLGEPKH